MMKRPNQDSIPGSTTAKTCIIIAGPTAVGKTALAIQVAKHFSTEIISCDSRQCFKELDIGVAKPSDAELAEVPHHFISSHSIHDSVSAATFEAYALKIVAGIFAKHDVAVMVGGTGLYIKAFCDGLDELPEIDPKIRQAITDEYSTHGIAWLQEQVKQSDPQYYASGEVANPQRLMRALEVVQSTGRSIRSFQTNIKKERDFNIIRIAIDLPRGTLITRINQRVDNMMQQGLLEEVHSLLPYQHLNALQTVGYRELFDYFNGSSSLSNAIEAIKINTRQYAKRQVTWFKKDTAMHWCCPELDEVVKITSSHTR